MDSVLQRGETSPESRIPLAHRVPTEQAAEGRVNPLRNIVFPVEGRKVRATRLRLGQPGEQRPTTRGPIPANTSGNRPEETTSTSDTAGLTIGEHYTLAQLLSSVERLDELLPNSLQSSYQQPHAGERSRPEFITDFLTVNRAVGLPVPP